MGHEEGNIKLRR